MSNVINVNLKKNSYAKHVPGLVQWDRGQYLQIAGVDFSGDVEVHFSLTDINGDAKRVEATMEDGMLIVKIPQFIVEEAGCWMGSYNAFAWIYVTNAESAQTEYKLVLEVQTRPKPDDYVYTPEEVKLWSQLEDKLGELDERMPDNMSAEVGQMIVVKAVDENGKPTEWEAVNVPTGGASHWDDIEGKPFYEEGEETVLFDGDITFSPDGKLKGQTQITYFEIEQGKTYKIDWNGYAYECASKQVELDNGVFVSYLGNAVLLEEEDTGENFLFYCGKDEAGENVSVAAYIPMTESKIPNERVIPCKIYHDGKIIHKLNNKFIDAEWMANDNAGTITILKEKEYTGGQTFRSYEETAINIQKVVEYESVTVICNGKEYECKPIYDEDDGSGEGDVFFLGNAGMWSEKYPNTGEPFMLMAYIGGVVILGVNTNEPYTFGIKRKNIVPIPNKFLPKGYGYLGEEGTEDVIFEQEVTFEDEDGAGFGGIDTTIEFIEGDMYILKLGEAEHECVAKSLTQTMDGVTATATWIGNAGIMGMENTGEPFLVVTQPMGQDENGDFTYGTMIVTEVFQSANLPVKITHIAGTPTIPFDEALIPPTIARKEDLQKYIDESILGGAW